jgi:hypothetical protein
MLPPTKRRKKAKNVEKKIYLIINEATVLDLFSAFDTDRATMMTA